VGHPPAEVLPRLQKHHRRAIMGAKDSRRAGAAARSVWEGLGRSAYHPRRRVAGRGRGS